MVYLVEKRLRKLYGIFDNAMIAQQYVADNKLERDNFYFLTELGMDYVNRITYVDGKCVYNNVPFWTSDLSDILEHYDEHEVKSVLDGSGTKDPEVISKERFISEYNNMCNKIAKIDGRPGQIMYNIAVGNEFIALFREECILTDFDSVESSPDDMYVKLAGVIGMIQTGSFREARHALSKMLQTPGFTDAFLTEARITKYIDMLAAADVIDYATADEYAYTAHASK